MLCCNEEKTYWRLKMSNCFGNEFDKLNNCQLCKVRASCYRVKSKKRTIERRELKKYLKKEKSLKLKEDVTKIIFKRTIEKKVIKKKIIKKRFKAKKKPVKKKKPERLPLVPILNYDDIKPLNRPLRDIIDSEKRKYKSTNVNAKFKGILYKSYKNVGENEN